MIVKGLGQIILAKKEELNRSSKEMYAYLDVSKGLYHGMVKHDEMKSLDRVVFFIELFGEPFKKILHEALDLHISQDDGFQEKNEIVALLTAHSGLLKNQTELLQQIANK